MPFHLEAFILEKNAPDLAHCHRDVIVLVLPGDQLRSQRRRVGHAKRSSMNICLNRRPFAAESREGLGLYRATEHEAVGNELHWGCVNVGLPDFEQCREVLVDSFVLSGGVREASLPLM